MGIVGRVRSWPRWKKITAGTVAGFLALSAFGHIVGDPGRPSPDPVAAEAESNSRQPASTPLLTAPTRSRVPTTKPGPPGRAYRVVDVVDGDTVKLAAVAGGAVVTARILGIDTPETKDPRRGVGCYGPEASAWARSVLTGTVRVRTDPTQDTRDQYGRLLAYVTLPSGADYSITAAREGYAKSYVYDQPVQAAGKIRAAEEQARSAGRGLWGPPCYGNTDAAPRTTTPAPQPPPEPPKPPVEDNCTPGYSPCLPVGPDLDCSDIDGPVAVTGSDPYRLDADGDGTGCDG